MRLPFSQRFVALFDRDPPPRVDYSNLNLRWSTPLGVFRRRFAAAMTDAPGAVVVYHDGWGLPFLHDLDAAARRMVFLHSSPSYHAAAFPGFRGLIDGAVGVTPALQASWPQLFRGEDVGPRTTIVRAPIAPPAGEFRQRPVAGRPLVLGFAGRLERAAKRMDRFPQLMRGLRDAGVEFKVELLGDGTLRPWLHRRMPAARFHGWVPKEQFWRVMSGWDAIVFCSETEGGPIALFEAMALGVLPFYPAVGGSWGDAYAAKLDPRCHYPPADPAAFAQAAGAVFRQPQASIDQLRARAKAMVAGHRSDAYRDECSRAIGAVAAAPRISATRARGFRSSDFIPLGFATRFIPSILRGGS